MVIAGLFANKSDVCFTTFLLTSFLIELLVSEMAGLTAAA